MSGPVGVGLWTQIWWPFFRGYVAHRLRRGLDDVWVSGLERTAALARERPLLLASNHVAWWDALLLIELKEALGVDGRCLMDADNLARFPFFRAAGALPLARDRRGAGRAHLDAAARWLSAPRRALWIFPQGRQRPAHLHPLDFKPGVQRLARDSGAAVVPVSIDYGFRASPRPTAAVAFGAPLPAHEVSSAWGLRRLEGEVAALQQRGSRVFDEGPRGSASFRPLWNRQSDDLAVGVGAKLLGAGDRP